VPVYYYGSGIAKERFQFFLDNPPVAISIDAETPTITERMPLGFAIAFSPEEAFYFQVHPEPPRELELLKPLLFNPKVCKIAHYALFDLSVLPMIPHVAGFDRSNLFDTNTAARLLGRELTALTILAPEVGMIAEDAKSFMQRLKVTNMLDAPAMEVANKCQQDAKAAFALYLDYEPKMASQYPDYFKVEMEVIPILIDLSMRGLAIDQRARAELEAKLEDEVEFYRRQLEQYGVEKPGSTQQVGYILGKRGSFLPMTRSKKQLSTREADLEFLDDPMAAATLGWRHKSKLLSTYISPIAGDDRFYCLHPDTRVLKADLSWERIADMKPGDEVIGLDMQGESGRSWKMTREKVDHLDLIKALAYKITTQYGSVIANGEHPWLVVFGGNYKGKALWVRTDQLNQHHKIKYICSPWEERTDDFLKGYLQGISDGDGYASHTLAGIAQKPGATFERILDMLWAAGFTSYVTDTGRDLMNVRFNMIESMRFLGVIRPERLLEDAYKVWEGRQPRGFEPASVESVEPIGETELVNMVTSNHTFIAEGMVTHNTEYYLDTVVGRLNSRNRNIQNIPLDCRHIFLSDNGCFTTGDYSQEHPRILAYVSQDREMLRVFDEKQDIHLNTAKKLGVSRDMAKRVNNAMHGGATATTVSVHTKIRNKDLCNKFIDDWSRVYRSAWDWIMYAQREGLKNGWALPTLFGRSIRIPDEFTKYGNLNKDAMMRKGSSYPILGSDGEIMKRAIILCRDKGLGPPVMAASVHDSLSFDGDVELPVEELEMIAGFRIPFEVKKTMRWE